MHHIKDENGTLITDRVQIANTLGAAIAKIPLQKITPKSSNLLRRKRKSNISTLKQTKIFVTIRSLR